MYFIKTILFYFCTNFTSAFAAVLIYDIVVDAEFVIVAYVVDLLHSGLKQKRLEIVVVVILDSAQAHPQQLRCQ